MKKDTILKLESVNIYKVVDIDNSAYPFYLGFMNDEGSWYIMRITSTGSVRYNRVSFQGSGLYSDAWNNRATLQYTYWSEGF